MCVTHIFLIAFIAIIVYLYIKNTTEPFYFEPSMIGQGDFHINNEFADDGSFTNVMDSYVEGQGEI